MTAPVAPAAAEGTGPAAEDHLVWTETTLRDGQQSLWATRMTTAMLLPILPEMDRAGFDAIEYMGTAVMDSCVRYLRENPWERMRLVRERVRSTPLGMILPSQFFSVQQQLPEDVVELLIRTCARNGIDRFWVLDTLNDMRTLAVPIAAARAEGCSVISGVCFAVSPVHTDAYFAERVAEVAALEVDAIVLKDANGLLTPERARTLVPVIRQAAGGLPVFVHTHCSLGWGPATVIESVAHGARGVWSAAAPLANGTSVPATDSMVRHLSDASLPVAVDAGAVAAISAHFRDVARRHGLPVGQPAEYDPRYLRHQMPGGMMSNFRAQLAQLGIAHRLDEVLEEMPAVHRDLGWPPMLTPFSQYVATQAALNVLYGRYRVCPEQVVKLALGHYGRTPAPVDPDVLDRVSEGREPTTAAPGDLLPRVVNEARRRRGPSTSDEDLLMSILFMPREIEALRAAGQIPLHDRAGGLVDFVREVTRRRDVRSLRVSQTTPRKK